MRSKLVYGVGINDYNKKITEGGMGIIQAYKTWSGMLKRCYDSRFHKKHPTYTDCLVCEEWKSFSNFKNWFDKNYIYGCQLDKDILIQGNKVYSPSTCSFVPQKINSILLDCGASRGKYKIGVSYHMRYKKYKATVNINGKNKHLGYFATEEEAYQEYCKNKKEIINSAALECLNNGTISKEIYNALLNYKIQ